MATRGRPSIAVLEARRTANAHLDEQAADMDWARYWAQYPAATAQEAHAAAEGAGLYTALRHWQRTHGQRLLERRANWAAERAA